LQPAALSAQIDFSRVPASRVAEGPHHEKLVKEYAKHFGDNLEAALAKIDALAINAYLHALKHTTRESYASGVARWEFFCNYFKLVPYPPTESMCERFVAASSVSLQADSISQYLSAVRNQCIDLREKMPEREAMPRVQRLLRGLKMSELQTKDGRVRMALTEDIADNTLSVAERDEQEAHSKGETIPDIYSLDNYKTLRAALSVPLIGLMRPSEWSVRMCANGQVVSAPLLVKHFQQVDNEHLQGHIAGANISLPQRKTDQFGLRSNIYIGITGRRVCGVSGVVDVLDERLKAGEAITGDSPLMLIRGKDGKLRAMTYEDLTTALSKSLRRAGYDDSKFKGHSFRIGGATSLALAGVPTNAIETMGNWKPGSLSLPDYIREEISAKQRRLMCAFFSRPYRRVEEEAIAITPVRRGQWCK